MRPRSDWESLTRSRELRDGDADEGLGVFVPGLMGAGILISGVILISDGVRHLLPSRGVRRRINVVRGVRRIVAGLAEAAGIEIEERNLIRRERRRFSSYLAAAGVGIPAAILAARWGFNAYSSSGSSLEGNAISIFYGLVAAAVVGGVGVVALLLAVPGLNPSPLRWIVAHTPFGKLAAPPDGVVERAKLLIPDLDKGANQ